MILAERKERPDYYQPEVSVPEVSSPKTRNVSIDYRRLAVNSALFVFAFCIVGVSLYIHSALLGYQINSLKSQISDLETQQMRLEYDIAQLSSLERVQKIAENRLHMLRPDTSNMMALSIESMADSVNVPASKKPNSQTADNGSQTLASILERLPAGEIDD